jgi:hypothetical protein
MPKCNIPTIVFLQCRHGKKCTSADRIGYGGKDYKNYTNTEAETMSRLQKETWAGSTKQYFQVMARIDALCLFYVYPSTYCSVLPVQVQQ